jgi:hypothetical protein
VYDETASATTSPTDMLLEEEWLRRSTPLQVLRGSAVVDKTSQQPKYPSNVQVADVHLSPGRETLKREHVAALRRQPSDKGTTLDGS